MDAPQEPIIPTPGLDQEEPGTTPDTLVHLQYTVLSGKFSDANCKRCPANGGSGRDYEVLGREHIYCALQAALMGGEWGQTARMTDNVEGTLGTEVSCSPLQGGRKIRRAAKRLGTYTDKDIGGPGSV